MRSRAPAWLWPGAVLAGLLLGVVGFVVAPLDPSVLDRRGPAGTPDSIAGSPGQPSANGSAEESPPFTRLALLQEAEFLDYGWGRSKQTAIHDGPGADLPTLCTSPRKVAADSEESYSGRYQGLQTEAVEIVTRHPDEAAAATAYERLADAVAECDDAARKRRADPATRHDPKLSDDIDDARWWSADVPAGSAGRKKPSAAVIALARIDDRVVYLMLTSTSSDPQQTVRVEDLLTQAARRMV